jgi:hypothetical protein
MICDSALRQHAIHQAEWVALYVRLLICKDLVIAVNGAPGLLYGMRRHYMRNLNQ